MLCVKLDLIEFDPLMIDWLSLMITKTRRKAVRGSV